MKNYISYISILITICCLSIQSINAQNAFWELKYPNLPTETIADICFLDDKNGIVIGEGGAVCRTTDGGTNWTLLKYATFNNLTKAFFVDSISGYIVGEEGTLLKSTDGGYKWLKINFNDTINLTSLHFINKDTGFVTADSSIYKTTNGGTTWTKQTMKIGQHTVRNITDIKFFGKDTGLAFYPRFASFSPTVLATTDGGTTWTHKPAINKNFYTVSFCDKQTGWAINDSGIYSSHYTDYDSYYKTTDGGTTWTHQYTSDNGVNTINKLHALDSNNVYIYNNTPGGGNGARVFYTNNGGESWSNNNSGFSWASAIMFISEKIGYAANIWGGIYKTFDGGITWQDQSKIDASNLVELHFIDSLYGWACGARRILRTVDGGNTWSNANLPSDYLYFVNVSFPDKRHGWVTTDNGYIYSSTDSGKTWTWHASSSHRKATDVKFFDSSFGIIARGDSKVDITHNGGKNWTTYNLTNNISLDIISYVDSLTWYGSSNYGFYKSSNAGITWSYMNNNGRVVDFRNFDTTLSYITNSHSIYKVVGNGTIWGANKLLYEYDIIEPKISFCDTLHGAVTNSYPYGDYKNPRIYITRNGINSWEQLQINSKRRASDIYMPDTANIWVTTLGGSIYHYNPANNFDSTLKPFLDTDVIVACASSTVQFKVTNHLTYSSADTVRAYLKQGNNTLQTLTIGSSGIVTFTTPSALGNYNIEVVVTNVIHKGGLVTQIPLKTVNAQQPYFSYSTHIKNPHCSTDTILVQRGGLYNLGEGFTYELHRLENNKDSILSVNEPITGTSGTDTFKLYYKIYLGSGICQPFPFFYSDTTTVNIIQPQKVNASITTDRLGNFACAGNGLSLVVNANHIGTLGQNYEFHKITVNNHDTIISSSDSNAFIIDTLIDTAYYYCRVFPGNNSCAINDTVHTDTIEVFVKPIVTSATAMLSVSSSVICTGDTVSFTATTVPPALYAEYNFLLKNGSVVVLAQSGATDQFLSNTINNLDSIYCLIRIDSLSCFEDTMVITKAIGIMVHPVPAQVIISRINDDTIAATKITGAIYYWYFNGTLVQGSNSDVFAPDSTGTYTVIVAVNGCSSISSGGFYFQKKSTINDIFRDGNNISITPNPTTGIANIHIEIFPANISVYSVNGQEIIAMSVNQANNTINIRDYPKGIYFISITNSKGTYTGKLILQ